LLDAISGSYAVQAESYRAVNRHNLDNRDVLSKWLYIGTWFDALLNAQSQGVAVLIVDRSPIDTIAYATDGEALLLPAILRSFSEIGRRDIHITSLLVTASQGELSARLAKRRMIEPHRLGSHEIDRAVEERAFVFYESHIRLWSEVIDTTRLRLDEAVQALRRVLPPP
jgi:hypothetical protein